MERLALFLLTADMLLIIGSETLQVEHLFDTLYNLRIVDRQL